MNGANPAPNPVNTKDLALLEITVRKKSIVIVEIKSTLIAVNIETAVFFHD